MQSAGNLSVGTIKRIHRRAGAPTSGGVCDPIWRGIRRCRDGQALVEFSLLLPLLFGLMFGIFEFGRLFYTRITVQHAVAEATRFAVTGNQLIDPITGQPIGRAASIKKALAGAATNVPVDVSGISINPPDGGAPEQVVTVSATFTYIFSLPTLGNVLPPLTFTVTTAMRNEPFFP